MMDATIADGHDDAKRAMESFARLYETIKRLRGPGGCPWDIEQTPVTLRETLIEEAYETVEAITEAHAGTSSAPASGEAVHGERPLGSLGVSPETRAEPDPSLVGHVREELGDVFLNATMIAYMYEQSGDFAVADSLDDISAKLVRRHPHVFGSTEGFAGPESAGKTDTAEKVLAQWDLIKRGVEGRAAESILDEVSRGMPALERANKLQKKAAKAGFDWASLDDVWPKVDEELAELRAAVASGDRAHAEDELGDLLFAIVNLSRHLKIDPGVALARTNAKFTRRFKHVERSMKAAGIPMDKAHLAEMDSFWDEAKRGERP
jgi:tetrapyrrole methylase family protein/MazG family protein